MYLSSDELKKTDKIKRLNLINSITGIKPGNLIGTVDASGQENLAVFSSIVHLGSHPALIGFILRPHTEVIRHTYENIINTGFYTINHIPTNFVENAHYTSAKFPKDVSEFDACGFTPEYQFGFQAPFVSESNIQLGMKFESQVPIPLNNTVMVIGSIVHLVVPNQSIDPAFYIDLEKAQSAGISGLNSYYSMTKIDSFPYARPHEVPKFRNHENTK